jgi:hypothetical protein
MAKNHKKPSPVQQMKLLTAHNRKEFFRKFERVVTLISGSSTTIKLIPPAILENYYIYRFHAVKVEAVLGNSIDPFVLEDVKQGILDHLRNNTTPVNEKGDTITLEEFMTIGLTLLLQTGRFEQTLEKTAAPFIALLKSLLKKQEVPESGLHSAMIIIRMMGLFVSNLSTTLYTVVAKNEQVEPKFYISAKICKHIQEKVYITIDGISRATVRVGWGFDLEGISWCMCSPALFGLPENDSSEKLPVYIQTHALQRLEERLDCVHTNLASYYIYDALMDGIIIKNPDNNFLIEYKFNTKKAGYLLAGIYGGKVVIRTFLFLTNNGTPEGKKLNELTGIQKHDKKYLSLDKLSTFMNPDLRKNETIRRLFFDAGCGDLFELTKGQTFGGVKDYNNVNVKSLLDYLKLKPVDAEAPPDFSDALGGAKYR